jgi:hypothetical protein
MKSSFGKGGNWRVTRLSSLLCLSVALLVIPVPSHAQLTLCNAVTPPTYCKAYAHIVGNTSPAKAFWRVVTKMGDQTVATGLGVWNGSGTKGAGVISESMGYAMILAVLYGDRATFDRLSATVQAGIKAGDDARKKLVPEGKSVPGLGLFPWFWCNNTSNAKSCPKASSDPTVYSIAVDADKPDVTPPLGLDSASDGDINIALAYIYADMAKTVYNWSDPTPTYLNALPPYFNTTPTYKMMAQSYIAAIRGAPRPADPQSLNGDFSTNDPNTANNYVLADGYAQATALFKDPNSNWHPDYSDIRAYQLFKMYDTDEGAAFWDKAISTTKVSWKAIFNFGFSDTRDENPNTGPINPAKFWVKLSNPTYQDLKATFMANPQSSPPDYSKVTADRGGGDPQLYTADSQRLPIRLLNYLNATNNKTVPDYMSMLGIANANLTALGTSYTNTSCKALTDRVSIGSPYASINPVFIQNFNAAGLLAYASNDTVPDLVQCPTGMHGANQPIKTDLAQKFGDGTCSTNSCPINNYLDDSDGFRALLSLWALTVSIGGQTPLQKYILSK